MNSSNDQRKLPSLKLLFLALFFSIGCGGGTHGTGGRLYEGTLTSEDGRILMRAQVPLSGITVTLAGTGESDVTDSNGQYSIESEVREASVEFLFQGSDLDTHFVLNDIPENAARVVVDFGVDQRNNSVAPTRIEEEEESHKPQKKPGGHEQEDNSSGHGSDDANDQAANRPDDHGGDDGSDNSGSGSHESEDNGGHDDGGMSDGSHGEDGSTQDGIDGHGEDDTGESAGEGADDASKPEEPEDTSSDREQEDAPEDESHDF